MTPDVGKNSRFLLADKLMTSISINIIRLNRSWWSERARLLLLDNIVLYTADIEQDHGVEVDSWVPNKRPPRVLLSSSAK